MESARTMRTLPTACTRLDTMRAESQYINPFRCRMMTCPTRCCTTSSPSCTKCNLSAWMISTTVVSRRESRRVSSPLVLLIGGDCQLCACPADRWISAVHKTSADKPHDHSEKVRHKRYKLIGQSDVSFALRLVAKWVR